MTAVASPGAPGAREPFQRLSYLQYPCMLIALGYVLRPYLNGFSTLLVDYSYVLLFAGIGIGLSSLQDPSRTQNTLSLRVWRDPRRGRCALWLIGATCAVCIVGGLAGTCAVPDAAWAQLAMGLLAFGIGMIGLLKTAIEMFENHRLDRRPDAAQGEAA